MQKKDTPRIVVTSKRGFPGWVEKTKNSGEPWAYISVEGTDDLVEAGLIKNNTHYLQGGPDVLNLRFDDVEEYTEHTWKEKTYHIYPISENQAKEILEFGEKHQGYNLLVHCYAGRSRSVAIAQGLLDVFPGVWKLDPESNPLNTPNMEVLRLLHRYGLWE